ncbi:MAG TPA: thiolase family protein [Acidimicrobiales bacterium]|nr:thiolase family protein [Acidimicrobiales bacterium]
MRTVAIAGVGWSEITRHSDGYEGDLALDASIEAMRDAGLSAGDVDGIVTHPGTKDHSVGPWYVATGLGLRELRWWSDVGGGPGAMAGLFAAVAAVKAGFADTVLHFRAIKRPTHRGAGAIVPSDDQPDDWSFKVPYGGISAAQWLGLWARHHMERFGTTYEQLGAVAVQTRAHACRNPRAVMQEPLDLEGYLASPWVSDPFRLLDCDVPVSGAAAVVVTTLDKARTLSSHPVRVEAMSCAPGPIPDWDQFDDYRWMAAKYAAADMWKQAPQLGPADVDVCELYDGFTFLTISWLEALGFCGLGEGGSFVEDGRIGPGGQLPTNTHGGNLSEGRLHGMGHIAEAVSQLQWSAAERQVPGARVAVVSGGGGPLAGALLLRRDEGD